MNNCKLAGSAFRLGLGFAALLLGAIGPNLALAAEATSITATKPAAGSTLTRVANMDASVRPSGVPGDYMLTPFGYVAPECLSEVAANDIVYGDAGEIKRGDGSSVKTPVCKQPTYALSGKPVPNDSASGVGASSATPAAAATSSAPAAVAVNGHSATQYGHIAPVGRLVVSFTIPARPANSSYVFYWPGFNGGALQPVVQWENNAWSLASWHCCYSLGQIIPASPGDRGEAEIYSTCAPGTANCAQWVIKTRNLTTGKTSVINYVGTVGSPGVIAMLLEAPGTSCARFPGDSVLVFHDVAVYDVNFKRLAAPPWIDTQGNQSCSDGIIDSGVNIKSTPSTVRLSY
jgi:hypothetical protein